MKSIMISIQPKWCELIASGKKTIEVRKTTPKYNEPFKVYIYQTKKKWIYRLLKKLGLYQGKVIGEFVVESVQICLPFDMASAFNTLQICEKACLTADELQKYAGNKTEICGLHISQLKIYDTPKELGEFEKFVEDGESYCGKFCYKCKLAYKGKDFNVTEEYKCPLQKVTRPPQSWCYVEEISE